MTPPCLQRSKRPPGETEVIKTRRLPAMLVILTFRNLGPIHGPARFLGRLTTRAGVSRQSVVATCHSSPTPCILSLAKVGVRQPSLFVLLTKSLHSPDNDNSDRYPAETCQ